MAFAILECIEPSTFSPTKTLKLEEGIPQNIGRCYEFDSVSPFNGLFKAKCAEICYQHAFLLYSNKKFFLVDTSIYGTYLNGRRILKNSMHNVISGDVIQLGGESFSIIGGFHLITFTVKLFTSEDADFINIVQKNMYGTSLQLYKEIPDIECSLSVLYQSVINRFEALKILDALGNINCMDEKLVDCILTQFREKDLCDMIKLVRGTSCSYEEEYNIQKMDHISHFVLCIASCRNHVMKKWFLDQEKQLLLLRWKFLTSYEKWKIISAHFNCFKEVDEYEKKEKAEASNGLVDPSLKYYKVLFVEASELIARRVVYIKTGSCYVNSDDFIYVIMTDFTKRIKVNLEKIRKHLHKIWNDERILSILLDIEKKVQFKQFLFRRNSTSIMLKEIDILAKQSFPLCMSILHCYLKQNNHLKNGGRFQYGLFLKGMGLSLNDSLNFWRYYLTKRISINEFIKYYNYHILHHYGANGKRADYPPQSCKKIFQAVPTFSEYHGCPFKLFDEENITSLLKKHELNTDEVKCIINIMKNGLPQLACSKYFEIKHGAPLQATVFHPNVYFEESRKLLKKRTEPQPDATNVETLTQNQNIRNCCSSNKSGQPQSCSSNKSGLLQSCSSFYDW